MTSLFTFLFIWSIISLTIVFFATRKIKSKKYVRPLRLSIISTAVMTLAHIFIINTQNEKVASVCYSVFFIFINIMIFSVFEFSKKYTKFKYRLKTLYKFFIGIICADSISLFLNIFFEHSFGLKKVPVPAFLNDSPKEIFKISMKWPYQLHLGLCYFIIILLIIIIIVKIITTPKIYRFMYSNILLAISINIFGDYFYVFLGAPIDFSIIFTAISVILLCIFTVYLTPEKLLQTQLQAVVSNMNDSVILFDTDGEAVYKNSSMIEFEKEFADENFNLNELFREIHTDKNITSLKDITDHNFDKEIQKNGKSFTFNIFIRTLKDENKKFLGAFFVIRDKTLETEKLNKEKYLAIHDKLTGLLNKDGFFEQVKEILLKNPDEKYMIICSDIDNFKLINDLFGRYAGDSFLIRVADSINKHARPEQLYARLESDRFGIFTKKSDYEEYLLTKNSKDVSSMSEKFHYPVTFHIGVYEIEDNTMPVSVMCDRAFMALKTIKGNLQKKIAYYNVELRKNLIYEQQVTGEFPVALENNQFEMYLQPQVKNDGNVYGAEALVRWNHPQNSIVYPNSFISILEKKGLIINLDKYIWECAAKKLKQWKDNGIEDMYISVNISPIDFIYTDIYQTFVNLVKKYDINPQRLKLEITESAILMNLEKQLVLINKLRSFGFQIEMDDFGSGYSSLNMLKDIPFDILKIDMAFLQATKNPERSIQILHSIIKLSKRLNMPVITEGVETKEQVEFLKDMGTDYYQGIYFARPMKVQDFESKYIKK